MTFELPQKRLSLLPAALLMALAMALLSPQQAIAGDAGVAAPQADELLREAVANEKPGASNGYLAWTDRLQKPHGSVTKLMVTTPQGILSRIVAIDDRALSADERRQEDERINRLLDPQRMHEKARKQQEDQQHIERLLAALPQAFHCSYASAGDDEHIARLECSPKPDFSPANFESQVLLGMRAEILIDRDEKRMTKISGTLFKDVSFGWGFVARLNRGGRIEIRQSKVAGNRWGITQMELLFDGRLILVKPLHIEESEAAWSYRSVPGMSVTQALDFLSSDPAATSRPVISANTKQ